MSNSIPNDWPMPVNMPAAEFQVRNIRRDSEWMRVSEEAYNDTSEIGFQDHIWERRKLYSASEGCTLVSDFDLNMLRERAEIPLRIGLDEVWHWQGDGHDFPESLACPVVMSADTLRKLIVASQQFSEATPGKRKDGEEVSVEEDVYWSIADMIDPYVQREGINPDGPLPASVHDSVQIIFAHWLKTRADGGEVQGEAANYRGVFLDTVGMLTQVSLRLGVELDADGGVKPLLDAIDALAARQNAPISQDGCILSYRIADALDEALATHLPKTGDKKRMAISGYTSKRVAERCNVGLSPLADKLRTIIKRTKPHADDTPDDRKRNLFHIETHAKEMLTMIGYSEEAPAVQS